MPKKSKASLNVILLASALFIFLFFIAQQEIEEPLSMGFNYYDSEGNKIMPPKTGFWIVDGGQFEPDYFTLTIELDNVGNVPLVASVSDASPSGFLTSLQSVGTLVVPVGQSGSWESDLMTVGDYIGDTEFSVSVFGEGGGFEKTVSKSRWLSIEADQFARFRTTSLGYSGLDSIAYSESCDGSTLSAYKLSSGGYSSGDCSGSHFLESHFEVPCDKGVPCYFAKDSKTIFWEADNRCYRQVFSAPGGTASTDATFTGSGMEVACGETVCEPVWDCTDWSPSECSAPDTQSRTCTDLNGCGTDAGKPSESQECSSGPVCGNSLVEPPEVCEDNMFGGETCESILGTGYTGTLQCVSECMQIDTTNCQEPEPYVRFRSTSWGYALFAPQSVGYASSCGDTLTKYGYEIRERASSSCNENSDFSQLLVSNIQGVDAGENSAGIWSLYQDDGDQDEVWLCQDDDDGSGSWTARYDTDDCPGDCSGLSDSPESVTPSLEVTC